MVGNALTLKMPSAQCLMPSEAQRSVKRTPVPKEIEP
jgi:hypothetical protein